MAKTIIDLKKADLTLGQAAASVHVLKGIDLSIDAGESVGIVGPSGSGKSTLLRCINGLEPIDSGDIELGGESISSGKTRWNLVRQRIGMVFQSSRIRYAPRSSRNRDRCAG